MCTFGTVWALINLLTDCRFKLLNERLTNLVSSGSSLLFLRPHWLAHFALPRIYPDRSIDFDNPKVYGDTSINDGLV